LLHAVVLGEEGAERLREVRVVIEQALTIRGLTGIDGLQEGSD
jgi:hypothetical protein